MSRLQHSLPAFRRLMQMSRKQLFVFVEGTETDQYFYGEICSSILIAINVTFELVASARLQGGGGKQIALAMYEFLDANGSLLDDFQGKRTGAFFFLDKDADDVLKRNVASAHICFTESYDVENYVFRHGDIIRGAAAAASLPRGSIAGQIADVGTWAARAARLWKVWVTLCLFSHKHGVNNPARYSHSSTVNIPANSAADPARVTDALAALERASGFAPDVFRRRLRAIVRFVDRLYQLNRQDVIFKGKWYSSILQAEVISAAAGNPFNGGGLNRRLAPVITATLDFEQPWAAYLKQTLRVIAEQI
jgi:hypothetical protein